MLLRSLRRAHRATAVFLRTGCGATSLASPVLYSLAFGAVGVAYLGLSTPGQRPALASPPPLPPQLLRAISGPSCPLPVGQQVKAVKAFREMMPVFRHARCKNCHGAFDIFSDRHPGADVLDTDLDFRVPMSREVRENDFADQCKVCHSELKTPAGNPGWMTSPPPMFFVNEKGVLKSDEQLCMQMKEQETTGASFVSHIKDDHEGIQFIEAAFAGVRALDSAVLKVERVKAEKPPGDHPALTEKARKWVKAVGDGYTASPECGCVMPKIKLKVHHTEVFEVPHGLPSKAESEVRFEVDLEPLGDERPNMYAGQQSARRDIKLTLPPICKGSGSRQERWVLYAMVDTASGNITVSRMVDDADEVEGDIECRQGGSTGKTRVTDEAAVTQLGYGEMVLPADSGSSKTVTEEYPATRESLTITVLEVPTTK